MLIFSQNYESTHLFLSIVHPSVHLFFTFHSSAKVTQIHTHNKYFTCLTLIYNVEEESSDEVNTLTVTFANHDKHDVSCLKKILTFTPV